MKIVLILMLSIVTSQMYCQEKFDLFFDSNQFALNNKENKILQDWIFTNKDAKILAIYGFTDEDGNTKFNDSLAQKRVDFIRKTIGNKVKIRQDFKSISFGENFEQSEIKAENRKVSIIYLQEKDLHKEAELLENQKNTTAIYKEIDFPNRVSVTNPNGSKSEIELDVVFMNQLNSAKKGEVIVLQNLNFLINTYIVVNESRGKLYQLLLVLLQNKKLKINIQGHLCCVSSDKKDLSTQRAKAIYKFLQFNGIDVQRMSYQGFGSTKPIFEIPEKNESEREANRRVEIEIMDN